MRLYLIRHGETKGNSEGRYVGVTDEGLTQKGREKLKNTDIKNVDRVYISPLKRCRESAELIFKNYEYVAVDDFRECDFGDFEYLNYEDLKYNKDYQKFIDSMGEHPFPRGEDRKSFCKRCCDAFEKVIFNEKSNSVGMVVHGGTIMAVLDKYSYPHKDYYEWQCKNGCGYVCEVEIENSNIYIKDIKMIGL